jgi:DNA-binding MurR/RpiR family transcriptional regulator
MYELDFKDYFTEKEEKEISDITRLVRKNYKDILFKAFELIDEEQMRRIATRLSNTEYTVPVYGMGSSGYVAREFQLRFMRLGLDVIAITDSQMIAMNASLVKRGSLVLAFSISGKSKEILEGIKKAKQNGAKVVLFTASKDKKLAEFCDEIVEVAYLTELENGTKISPQISILIILDVLYSYYFANDSFFKAEKYKRTLSALDIDKM